jgi:hypothetical protein
VVLGRDERQIRGRQRRSLQGRSFIDGFQFWASRLPRWDTPTTLYKTRIL